MLRTVIKDLSPFVAWVLERDGIPYTSREIEGIGQYTEFQTAISARRFRNALEDAVCTEERRKEWEKLRPPTEQVRLHLLHLVASHHGTMEFGSPVVPKTPEAFVLHHADDLDAKMEMLRGAYAESPQLSEHIRQRKMPLPGNVVDSLPRVSRAEEEDA